MNASQSQEQYIPKDMLKVFKVIIIGDSGVGKTSFVNRIRVKHFQDNTFNDSMLCSIGVDFVNKMLNVNQKPVKIQFWDTAGQERFRALSTNYYKYAKAVLIFFDVTDTKSFEVADKWFEDTKQFVETNCTYFLIGSKIDLTNSRQISYDIAYQYAQTNNMIYIEISSKTGQQFKETLEIIAEVLVSQNEFYNNPEQQIDQLTSHKEQNYSSKKSNCC